jgi:hypothetical protein
MQMAETLGGRASIDEPEHGVWSLLLIRDAQAKTKPSEAKIGAR